MNNFMQEALQLLFRWVKVTMKDEHSISSAMIVEKLFKAVLLRVDHAFTHRECNFKNLKTEAE